MNIGCINTNEIRIVEREYKNNLIEPCKTRKMTAKERKHYAKYTGTGEKVSIVVPAYKVVLY